MSKKRKKSFVPRDRTNFEIKAQEIRVVQSEELDGIVNTKVAISAAKNAGKDLVMVTEKANPPVCRIIEYSKFIYEQKKKKKEAAKSNQNKKVKELRFTPNIGEHDLKRMVGQAIKFLTAGHEVKFSIQFRGREVVNARKNGLELTQRIVEGIGESGKLANVPKLNGKRMVGSLRPR